MDLAYQFDKWRAIGLLVLASEDKQRFYPEMGTVFLQRIAEAASGALHPHISQT